jgi:hypothetical protein
MGHQSPGLNTELVARLGEGGIAYYFLFSDFKIQLSEDEK